MELEETNYGPAIDRFVYRARRLQRRVGVDPDYDLVRQHFDHYHYLMQVRSSDPSADPAVDPIRRFLHVGASARFSPSPHFSMARYLDRNPDRAEGEERSPYLEWLKRGRDRGENADPAEGIEALAPVLGLSEAEVRDELVRLRTDMTQRLRYGVLGEMFAKAAEVEPLIGEAWRETARYTSQLPLRTESVAHAVAALHTAHADAGHRPARAVVVCGEPRPVGHGIEVDLIEGLVASMPATEVVVIYTDMPGTSPHGRFPEGVREVGFALDPGAVELAEREQSLVALVRSFRADVVVNVDSRLFYGALAAFGKALAHSERIVLAFGADSRPPLDWAGTAGRGLYSSEAWRSGIVTDSTRVKDALAEHFSLPDGSAADIHVLPTPAATPPTSPVPAPDGDAVRRVGWLVGHALLDRDELRTLAGRRRDLSVRLWTPADVLDSSFGRLDNVSGPGPFSAEGLAGLEACVVTEPWAEPRHLLAIAAAGVPVLARRGGSAEEILHADESVFVDSAAELEPRLDEVLADVPAALERAARLRERVLAARPRASYDAGVRAVLLSHEGGDA